MNTSCSGSKLHASCKRRSALAGTIEGSRRMCPLFINPLHFKLQHPNGNLTRRSRGRNPCESAADVAPTALQETTPLSRRVAVASPDVVDKGVILEAVVPLTSSLSQIITVILKKPLGLVLAGKLRGLRILQAGPRIGVGHLLVPA